MSYVRKTRDEYSVQGNYGHHGWEELTIEETRQEARGTLKLYNHNEPKFLHRIVKRRVPIKSDR